MRLLTSNTPLAKQPDNATPKHAVAPLAPEKDGRDMCSNMLINTWPECSVYHLGEDREQHDGPVRGTTIAGTLIFVKPS